LRLVVAVVLPAVAVEVAFPVLHAFTTVYNEPENPISSFALSLLLTAVSWHHARRIGSHSLAIRHGHRTVAKRTS
jgi:ABC-type uncharacterized transport system permease subunit